MLGQRRCRHSQLFTGLTSTKASQLLVDRDPALSSKIQDFSCITDEYKYVVVRLKLVYLLNTCRSTEDLDFFKNKGCPMPPKRTLEIYNRYMQNYVDLYGDEDGYEHVHDGKRGAQPLYMLIAFFETMKCSFLFLNKDLSNS